MNGDTLRTGAAMVALMFVALVLAWGGIQGNMGDVLGALLCPAQMQTRDGSGAWVDPPALATADVVTPTGTPVAAPTGSGATGGGGGGLKQ